MSVVFHLPPEIERGLRGQLANLDEAAKEALVLEMFRQGKLTQEQLAQALRLSPAQIDQLLRQHGAGNGKEKAQKDAQSTPAQRAALWQELVGKWRLWARENLPPGHVVDDSRESIYEGRGE